MKKLLLLFTLIPVLGCTPDLEVPKAESGSADYSKFAAIGDGYMAGYQDGALWHDAQERSVAALIFSSLRETGSMSFNQALISDNTGIGINLKPWEGAYTTSARLDYVTDCEGVTSLMPAFSVHSSGSAGAYLSSVSVADLDDFTFPFAKTGDFLSTSLNTSNIYYNRVASSLSFASPLQAMLNRQPTFFAAWLGMEDIYDYARNGGYNVTLPSPSQFSAQLDSILQPLTASGAKGVIANIPDFRKFPFYTLVPYNGATLAQTDADSLTNLYISFGMPHISFHEGDNAFVIADPNAPSGYRQMVNGEYINLAVPIDSMKCYYYGVLVNTIHDRYSLDSTEVPYLDDVISQYNQVIRQKAIQYQLAFVDMDAYYSTVMSGMKWNGTDINAEFVTGGFFSLDGFTPTQKGAALIANQFIRAMNDYYGSTLHTIVCEECNGVLFP